MSRFEGIKTIYSMKTQTKTSHQQFLKSIFSFGIIMTLCFFTNTLSAQNASRTVSGIVTSEDGPLLGATIVLKGTTVGVTSDESGAFKFPKKLKENDILLVSYLGYLTREVRINSKTSYIEPFLEDDPVILYTSLRTSIPKEASGSN